MRSVFVELTGLTPGAYLWLAESKPSGSAP